jgi:DNA ligase-1
MNSDQAYEVIEGIRQAGGNTKLAILKKYPEMKPYLLAAYDPYKMYYNTKSNQGYGTNQFRTTTWVLLEDLNSRRLSGMVAQTAIDQHMKTMSNMSSILFNRILNKDLRMGMGAKSINKVFPGLIPVHDVMLAKLFKVNRLKFPVFGSPKLDGVRAKFKNGIFYSRKGHPFVGLEHVSSQLQDITHELDGELTVPGLSFQKGSGLIRSDNPTPMAQFDIFELPTVTDPFRVRLIMMEDLHLIGPNIIRVPHKVLYDEKEVHDYYNVCRATGYEGAVIKPFDYEYKGTRSWNWMKMKPKDNPDLVVVGVYEGKGKYKEQLGGVVVDFNGKPNRVGGGFSDKQRKLFWEKPGLIISETVEVEYMEKTDDGNMRHSRFIRIREDK